MMMGNEMMTDLMIGSGWLGLLVCMVVGIIARFPLAAAGMRRAEGRPWAVLGAVGFGLLAISLLAAFSALGSFFGIMGLGFAAIMGLGGVQAFTAAGRHRRAQQAQIDHAARIGAALRTGQGPEQWAGEQPGSPYGSGSTAPATPPAPAPGPTTGPTSSSSGSTAEPTWYSHDDEWPGGR